VGRVIFKRDLAEELGFFNKVAARSSWATSSGRTYKVCGHEKTVEMLDKLKELGFRWATAFRHLHRHDDMIIPKEKDQEIDNAHKQIARSRSNTAGRHHRRRALQQGHRHLDPLHGDQIANVMFRTLEHNQGARNTTPSP
jgi:DNA-directed RNA polymerase subunit beta'